MALPSRGSSWWPHILPSLVTVASAGLLFLTPLQAADPSPSGVAIYRGIHPIWPQTGGFCYIDVRHVHSKRPTDLRVYRVLPNDENLFVGDPVALGYDGPKFGYFGPHPLVQVESTPDVLYCYIRGPHFHAEQPRPGSAFALKAGVYWFIGTFPPAFERDRHYAWVNDSPVLTAYQPPRVSLADAPPGFQLPDAVQVPATTPPPPVPVPGKPATKTPSPRASVKRGPS